MAGDACEIVTAGPMLTTLSRDREPDYCIAGTVLSGAPAALAAGPAAGTAAARGAGGVGAGSGADCRLAAGGGGFRFGGSGGLRAGAAGTAAEDGGGSGAAPAAGIPGGPAGSAFMMLTEGIEAAEGKFQLLGAAAVVALSFSGAGGGLAASAGWALEGQAAA